MHLLALKYALAVIHAVLVKVAQLTAVALLILPNSAQILMFVLVLDKIVTLNHALAVIHVVLVKAAQLMAAVLLVILHSAQV